MKKFYLACLALILMCTSANAQAVRNLYSQDFESVTNILETWASPNIADGLKIASDTEGSYLSVTTSGAGARSARTVWGDVYDGCTNYTLSFDFQFKAYSTYYDTELCIMSTSGDIPGGGNANANYAALEEYIFDLTQQGTADYQTTFNINGNADEQVTIPAATWLTLNLNVDGKNVNYSISDKYSEAILKQGSYVLADTVEYKASGIWYRAARGFGEANFDEILITSEVEGAWANAPKVVKTGLWQNERYYTITFGESETLHYVLPGTTDEIAVEAWDAVNPDYLPGIHNITVATSGQLKVWTTSGESKSEEVLVDVVAEPITLVAPTATIASVAAGYGKTYQISVDNSSVELVPQIFLHAKFTPDGEGTAFDKDISNGEKVEVDGKGTLYITANTVVLTEGDHAGTRAYNESSTTVINNIDYQAAADYDFAHLTEEQILKAGFKATDNAEAQSSLCSRFASYGRLYWFDSEDYMNEDGSINEAHRHRYEVIPAYVKLSSEFESSADSTLIFENVVHASIPAVNFRVLKGVGLFAEGQKGDDMSGSWKQTTDYKINGLEATDFIVASYYTNYGSDALHPVVSSEEEYLACHNAPVQVVVKGTETISITRISDLMARLQVFKPTNLAQGIMEVSKENVVLNTNAPVYTLSGVRVDKNSLGKGVYIQNGKKFVVK